MSEEKREKREYEAIGPVPNVFGPQFMHGEPIPFQRMDTGATIWASVEEMRRVRMEGQAMVCFSGTIARGLHEGEAVSGMYNVATMKTVLTTWFEL